MTVRLILGRAGSGKTQHCIESIAAELDRDPTPAAPPLFFLVPEQMTYMMERALLARRGGRAFTRAQVVSFRRLANWVFGQTSGPLLPAIGELERRLLLRAVLDARAPGLQVFRVSAERAAFELEIARVLQEFLRQRITPQVLRETASRIRQGAAGDSGPATADTLLPMKLEDLATIFEDYQQAIAGRFLNAEETPNHLAQALARAQLLANADVWIDGFASFNAQELTALGEILRQSRRVDLCLCLDPSEGPAEIAGIGGGLFAETRHTRDLVEAFCERNRIERAPGVHLPAKGKEMPRFSGAPALAHLERHWQRARPLEGIGAAPGATLQPVQLLQASSPRAEAELIVREFRRLHDEGGIRWREMSLLCRNIDAALPTLLPIFREHQVPVFCDTVRSVTSHPLRVFLQSALRIALKGWFSEEILAFHRTGLTGVAGRALDRIENYVLEHGINGDAAWRGGADWSAWPRFSAPGDDEEVESQERRRRRMTYLRYVNLVRRAVVGKLAEWETKWFHARAGGSPESEAGKRISAQALARALEDLLERFDVRQVLEDWEWLASERSDWVEVETERRILGSVQGAVRAIPAALGERMLSADEAISILEAALESIPLGIIPAGFDEVTLASLERSRQPPLRVAWVPFLNEGEFPHPTSEDAMLTDREREVLLASGCSVAPPASQRFLAESYLAYIACTRADSALIVSRSTTEADGSAAAPSVYWTHLRRLFPHVAIGNSVSIAGAVAMAGDAWAGASTPGRWLGTWAREWRRASEQHDTQDSTKTQSELLDVLRESLHAHALRSLAPWLVPAALGDVRAALDPRRLGDLVFPGGAHSSSFSGMEVFAACPYRYFARSVLRLEERQEFGVEATDIGTLYHSILHRWLAGYIAAPERFEEPIHPHRIAAEVQELVTRIAPDIKNQVFASDARWKYWLGRITGTITLAAENVMAAIQAGEYRPVLLEVAYRGGGAIGAYEVELKTKQRLRIRGQIDRVDARRLPDGGVSFLVIDYKRTKADFRWSAWASGLSQQLTGYLLALVRTRGAAAALGGEPRPAAAFYMPILGDRPSYSHPGEEAAATRESMYSLRKRRGFLAEAAVDHLESVAAGAKALHHRFGRKKDGALSSVGDVIPESSLAAMLDYHEEQLRAAGERLAAGEIPVEPTGISGGGLPCDFCSYAAVCRIDPGRNPGRRVASMRKADVLEQLADRGGDSGQ